MRRLPVLLTAVLLSAAVNAQYWKAVGLGTVGPTEIQTLYGDSISNRLLAGGTFLHIKNENDTVLAYGQAAWNGTRWDSLATRIQGFEGGEGVHQTYWFLRFQGVLFACGNFALPQSNGELTDNLARLDEQTQHWEGLGCNIPSISGIETLVPKEPDTTLYATGYMGTICDYPQSCVFRYDGSAFHIWEPFNQIPNGNDNYVGTVFDFHGKTYMSCSLPDPTGPGFVSFIRWNGTSWEHVPGWNTLSPIKDISIHNDTLYVAGTFSLADGGPGNLVAAFDGENWSAMGGGLGYPPAPMSGAALDLEWFHGELWASGVFSKAGNANCTGIAHWDGHRWCVPPGVILHANGQYGEAITDMAVWRDSLYICGGFATIDGEPIRQVAQWIGGDAVEECSTVGISEVERHSTDLSVTPLADPGSWTVHFPHTGNWSMEVYDAVGRRVRSLHGSGETMELNLSSEATGVYMLRAVSGTDSPRSAKVLRP